MSETKPKPKSKRGPISASELISRLESNPEYLAKLEEKKSRLAPLIAAARLAQAPMLEELSSAGFKLETVADLYNRRLDYQLAIPILLRWLPLVANTDVKESIVRSLSVKWAKPTATPLLVREFEKAPPDAKSLKWAIANALSVVADDDAADDLIRLVKEPHGKSRQMLALALGNMKEHRERAVDLLIDLLDDGEVTGHAVMALGNLKAKRARPSIQRFLDHEKAWVRKEAKRATDKIGKERSR